jgi:hypothetical protein
VSATVRFIIAVSVFIACLLSARARAQENLGTGGKWHTEAFEAWKVYNQGRDTSEGALERFIDHGSAKEHLRYYEMACDKGSINFCTLGGISCQSENKKLALKMFRKGCDALHDDNNCIGAVDAYLGLGQIDKASEIFKSYCHEGMLNCDNSDIPRLKKNYYKLFTLACSEGHEFSCALAKKHGIKQVSNPARVDK